MISIDTLRADHLHCYGYPRPTSPHLDRLAEQSILFEHARSVSFHTADSHMSIFTSVYPSVHRIRNTTDKRHANRLSEDIRTFPEALQSAGFATAGFHGGGNVSGVYGFDRGYELYQSTLNDLEPAIRWLTERRRDPGRRFFLFAHTFRTHDPYLPDPPFNQLWGADYRGDVYSDASAFEAGLPSKDFATRRDRFWRSVDPTRPADIEKIVALYDGAIRQADDEVGALLANVDSLPQRVMVVVLSDHGEEFFEHGGKLHDELFDETIHVPLFIRHPDRHGAGTRIHWDVSLLDVVPTISEALGVETLPLAQGRSLLATLRRGTNPHRAILAEKVVGEPHRKLDPSSLKQALLVGGQKLIAWPNRDWQLFDLRLDPGELADAAPTDAAGLARLRRQLSYLNQSNDKLFESIPRPSLPSQLDDETKQRLRALGYL